jgi:hypothetical protein
MLNPLLVSSTPSATALVSAARCSTALQLPPPSASSAAKQIERAPRLVPTMPLLRKSPETSKRSVLQGCFGAEARRQRACIGRCGRCVGVESCALLHALHTTPRYQ